MIPSIGSKTYCHVVFSLIRSCLVLNASFGLMLNDGLLFQELLVSMKKWGGHYIPCFFYPRLHIWLTQPHIFRNSSQSFDPLLKSCVSVRSRACLRLQKGASALKGWVLHLLALELAKLGLQTQRGGWRNHRDFQFNFLEMPGKLGSFGYRMPKVVGPNVSDQTWKCNSEHASAGLAGSQGNGRGGQWKEGSEIFSFQWVFV